MTVYEWPGFTLEFNPATGEAITRYPGGKWSGCGVVEGDHIHASRLGITAKDHRLQHELAHHLIGLRYYRQPFGSPVIWRDAHGIPQETGGMVKPDWSEADREEWLANAIQYRSLERPHEDGAVSMLLLAGVDVGAVCAELRWLMQAAALHIACVEVTTGNVKGYQ